MATAAAGRKLSPMKDERAPLVAKRNERERTGKAEGNKTTSDDEKKQRQGNACEESGKQGNRVSGGREGIEESVSRAPKRISGHQLDRHGSR